MLFETYSVTGYTNNGYSSVLGGNFRTTTEAEVSTYVPINCTLKRFRVRATSAFGAGDGVTWTFRINGVDTAATVTISGATQTDGEYVGDISVSAGDIVSISHVVSSGAPPGKIFAYSWLWDSEDATSSFLSGEAYPTMGAGTYYLPFAGTTRFNDTVEFNREVIAPSSFTLKNLYVIITNAPVGAKTRTYTVRKNGAATGLTCSITGAATTGSDTTNSVSVADGDTFCLEHSYAGVAGPVVCQTRYSVEVQADKRGEFICANANRDNWNAAGEYGQVVGCTPNYGGARNSFREDLTEQFRVQFLKMWAEVSAAPGAFASRYFILQKENADTAFSVVISQAATKGSVTTRLPYYPEERFHQRSYNLGGVGVTPVGHTSLLARVQTVQDVIQHGGVAYPR
jgi:hypothetical protein